MVHKKKKKNKENLNRLAPVGILFLRNLASRWVASVASVACRPGRSSSRYIFVFDRGSPFVHCSEPEVNYRVA